jgi:two-component system, chemotaxis family, chemotaxis protein CheY
MPNERNISAERLASTKVLVVNDDHDLRKFIRNLLAIMGFRNICQAANGPAGLDLINAKTFDIVILDWEMAGLDGPGFVRAVRSPGKSPMSEVPIIMLTSTAHANRNRVIDAVRFGVNEFLVKPISLQSLRKRVTDVLGCA